MILSTKCPNCSTQCPVKGNYSDRGEMAKKLGDEFEISCEECNRRSKVNVADIKAKESKIFKLVSLFTCLGLLGLFIIFGAPYILESLNHYFTVMACFVILSPIIIYIALMNGHRKSVSQFNRYRN